MSKRILINAALLTWLMVSPATADDKTEQRNKRTQKVLATLQMLGIADPRLNSIVSSATSRIEKDGFFYVADKKMEEGRLALRFECRGMPKATKMQLAYVPKDSNYVVTANTRGLMINYHYSFK